jgi:hypothetical protein
VTFQLKDFASIVASQINHARSVTDRLTDFQPGSVARTLMEAPAVEVEELYLQMFLGLRDAIPVATFLSFGFDRLPSKYARGFVSVSITPAPQADITVGEGAVFTATDGRSYLVSEAAVWPAGDTISPRIAVIAAAPGFAGNAALGSINGSALFGADYTVTSEAVVGGADAETDGEREARFAEFVRSLSRGTLPACMYAAKQARVEDDEGNVLEYVTRAGVDEQPGRVRIYLYTSAGTPSAALLADGQVRLDGTEDTPGFRAAGVRVDLLPMQQRAVAHSIKVAMLPGFPLNDVVRQQLRDVYGSAIAAVQPGETLLLGDLDELLLTVPGVREVAPVTTANIVCAVSEALTAGTLTIAAL